jgi:hypothetical protein
VSYPSKPSRFMYQFRYPQLGNTLFAYPSVTGFVGSLYFLFSMRCYEYVPRILLKSYTVNSLLPGVCWEWSVPVPFIFRLHEKISQKVNSKCKHHDFALVLAWMSSWLRIGTIGGLLWTRWWTFGFHKMLGSSWVAAQLAASQEGLSSVSK